MTDKTAGAETLPAKIARIALEIGQKDPIKHSRDVKFAYHSARDVYGWWKEAIQKESIILIPKVLSVDVQFVEIPKSSGGTRKTFLTTLNVEFTMKDGVTNEYFVGSAVGQGEDPSDKGAGKAMTYAEKAFLLGLGMNGAEMDNEAYSDDDRDYDRRDRRDRRRAGRGGAPDEGTGCGHGTSLTWAARRAPTCVSRLARDRCHGPVSRPGPGRLG